MNVATLRLKIPELLTGLGEDPGKLTLGDDAWVVHRGSVTGYVAILGANEPEADPFLRRCRGAGAAGADNADRASRRPV